jgi:hypothetical protein
VTGTPVRMLPAAGLLAGPLPEARLGGLWSVIQPRSSRIARQPTGRNLLDRTAGGSSSLLPDFAHHAGIGIMTRSDIILVELMAKG